MKITYRCGRCNFKWSPKGDRTPSRCISCGSDRISNISDHLKNVLDLEGVDLVD